MHRKPDHARAQFLGWERPRFGCYRSRSARQRRWEQLRVGLPAGQYRCARLRFKGSAVNHGPHLRPGRTKSVQAM